MTRLPWLKGLCVTLWVCLAAGFADTASAQMHRSNTRPVLTLRERVRQQDLNTIPHQPEPLGTPGRPIAGSSDQQTVEGRIVSDARRVTSPGDLSFALERAARALIISTRFQQGVNSLFDSGQAAADVPEAGLRNALVFALDVAARQQAIGSRSSEALTALRQAGQAARGVSDPTLRDVRLLTASKTALVMVERLMQDAVVAQTSTDDLSSLSGNTRSAYSPGERWRFLQQAIEALNLAGDLASQVSNENYRSEGLSVVAQAEAKCSQLVAGFVEKMGDQTYDSEQMSLFARQSDEILSSASRRTWLIPIPLWRDRTLVDVVNWASKGNLFARGRQIALTIPQAEARADALIRVAEAQARDGLADDASQSYQDAVMVVARIPRDGPRQSVAAVLLDSLISVGRFEDARLAATLIRDPEFRLRALGAVARAMGASGLDAQAYRWIEQETALQIRDRLRRDVVEGLYELTRKRSTTQEGQYGRDILSEEELQRLRSPFPDENP